MVYNILARLHNSAVVQQLHIVDVESRILIQLLPKWYFSLPQRTYVSEVVLQLVNLLHYKPSRFFLVFFAHLRLFLFRYLLELLSLALNLSLNLLDHHL